MAAPAEVTRVVAEVQPAVNQHKSQWTPTQQLSGLV